MIDPRELRGLEERALNAWPALETQLVDGWLLRFADGFSKRANSACALPGAAALPEVLPQIEERYRRAGIACCLRLTPQAPPGTQALLDRLGWIPLDETIIQVRPLAGFAEPPPATDDIELAPRASAAWIDGYALARARPDLRRDTLARMLAMIGPPAAFATLRSGGKPVAYGMGVLERGRVGLFDVATAADHRGRGHARSVVATLLAWGRAGGADGAYLQVTADNAPALALYGRLGFTEAYRYRYAAPP